MHKYVNCQGWVKAGMRKIIKIVLLAILPFSLAVYVIALACCYISGTSWDAMISKYENDLDNDGVAEKVYYYTYDVTENLVKLGIDSDNDGAINEIYNYNLGKVMQGKRL